MVVACQMRSEGNLAGCFWSQVWWKASGRPSAWLASKQALMRAAGHDFSLSSMPIPVEGWRLARHWSGKEQAWTHDVKAFLPNVFSRAFTHDDSSISRQSPSTLTAQCNTWRKIQAMPTPTSHLDSTNNVQPVRSLRGCVCRAPVSGKGAECSR